MIGTAWNGVKQGVQAVDDGLGRTIDGARSVGQNVKGFAKTAVDTLEETPYIGQVVPGTRKVLEVAEQVKEVPSKYTKKGIEYLEETPYVGRVVKVAESGINQAHE